MSPYKATHYMLFLNSVNDISLLQGDSKARSGLVTVADIVKATQNISTPTTESGATIKIVSQKCSGSSETSQEHYLVSQRIAKKHSNAENMASSELGKEHGLKCNVAVAVPLAYNPLTKQYQPEEMKSGDLFTFLPLNIKTGANFHINGAFALSSNRKTLWQDDEKGSKNDIRVQWNELLMKEEVPKAVINLMKEMKVNQDINTPSFDFLWPQAQLGSSSISHKLSLGFYQMLVQSQDELFFSELSQKWLNYESCYLADFSEVEPGLRETFHKILLTYLKKEKDPKAELVFFNSWALDGIKLADGEDALRSRTFSTTRFYTEVFLPRISQIEENGRDKVMTFMLSTPVLDDGVKEPLKRTACIKTSHSKQLLKPGDPVHPVDSITKLYLKEEDLFPHELHYSNLAVLTSLGMKTEIKPSILMNRAEFLDCGRATFPESSEQVKNIATELLQAIKARWQVDNDSLWISQLSQYHWIESTKSTLCRTDQLWSPDAAPFVSYTRDTVKPIPGYLKDFLKAVCVRDDVSTEDMVSQLVGLHKDFPSDTSKRESYYRQMKLNLELLGGRADMCESIKAGTSWRSTDHLVVTKMMRLVKTIVLILRRIGRKFDIKSENEYRVQVYLCT